MPTRPRVPIWIVALGTVVFSPLFPHAIVLIATAYSGSNAAGVWPEWHLVRHELPEGATHQSLGQRPRN